MFLVLRRVRNEDERRNARKRRRNRVPPKRTQRLRAKTPRLRDPNGTRAQPQAPNDGNSRKISPRLQRKTRINGTQQKQCLPKTN